MRRRTSLVAFIVALAIGLHASDEPTTLVGRVFDYVVRHGDTWISLSARFGIEAGVLADLNNVVRPKPPTVGDVLRIDGRHLVPEGIQTGILINIPQRMLFVLEAGMVLASYPVGLGRPDWPTFVGPFTVIGMETNPVWDVPPSIQEELRRAGKKVLTHVPPGPSNPLGKYWLALSAVNYGIHGTNAPLSIYRFQTHGCVRLHPDDIADLWTHVTLGMPGETVYQPVLMRMTTFGIMVEAHRDVYRRMPDSMAAVRSEAAVRGWEGRVDWELAAQVLRDRTGRPILVETR